MKERLVPDKKIKELFLSILAKENVRADVAGFLVEGIVQASLRGVDSHGIRLFPHYLQGFIHGRLNREPKYDFKLTAPSTGKLDGDHAPGHAAGAEGMLKAIGIARTNGIGAVAVHNSSHFGAAAYYAHLAAREEMIGLSFTHATAHVLPYGGLRPFLGNNPICLVAPCEGEEPFCLDMATTVTNFNKVQQYKEQGKQMPPGWGVDENGDETTDPNKLSSLLPIGGYKGFGLSMMVEILCGLLTGAPYGQNVSRMFGTPLSDKRRLGHFFMAIRIDAFEEPKVFKKRLKTMMDELRREPAKDKNFPVMAPGDPEKRCFAERSLKGIPVPEILAKELITLAEKHQLTSFD
ncbi:MAG: Ldh family oxidoreductase [Candidatus Margulisiibacteriota bacterium]